MNKTLSDLLDEMESKREVSREIKEAIRTAKKEGTLIKEDSEAAYWGAVKHTLIYDAFVQPFVNVLKASKLLAMNVSNAVQTIFKIINIVDDDELEEVLEESNARRQEINKDWKPLMDEADRVLGSIDPIYMMSLVGPKTFMSIKGFGAGLAAGKTIAEVLTATRWEKIVNNFTTKLDPSETLNKNSKRILMLQKRTLKKLNKIFFVSTSSSTSYNESVNRMLEQDSKSLSDRLPEESETMTEEEAVEKFLEITGLKKQLDELRIENSENLIMTSQKIKEQIKPLTFATSLLAASDLKGLNEVVNEMRRGGIKASISLQKISEEVRGKAALLSKDPEFLKTLSDQLVTESIDSQANNIDKSDSKSSAEVQNPASGAKVIAQNSDQKQDKIDPRKAYEAAEKAIFNASKEKINMEIIRQIKTSVPLVKKLIDDLKIDDKILSEMKRSKDPVVIRATKIYEELQISYKKITEDLKKVVP